MQEDTFVATLTALETLKFRAALSVPSNVLKTQRKERIQEVLAILGLWRVRDTKVIAHAYNTFPPHSKLVTRVSHLLPNSQCM